MKPQKDAAAAVNGFAAELFPRLAGMSDTKASSQFFSPFSIAAALAMTSAGARGQTLEEMRKVLHLPNDPHPAFAALTNRLNATGLDKLRLYQLSVANAIWAQKGYPWSTDFMALTRKYYRAGVVEVDFAEREPARKRINDWVEKETREKIKDLVPSGSITALTRMVLANAIYFKSKWLYQFDAKKTTDAAFTRDDGTEANVPLMTLTARLNYGETLIGRRCAQPIRMLELPYTGKELSMIIYLPERPNGTAHIAGAIAATASEKTVLKPTEVKVFLPRFKAESTFALRSTLMEMGMKSAFGNADFTGMSPNGKELYISEVLHKAFVDVKEEGTEAAAATAVILKERIISAPPEPIEFRADRPFAFAIRENATGAMLFLGSYSGPSA
jgi:serpin B